MTGEPDGGWNVIDTECAACLYRWAAVAPAEAGIGSLQCPSCGHLRSRVYTPRNLTACEHLILARRLVGRVYSDLPTDHPAERTLAQALAQLRAVAGEETEGPFGPYVAVGHL